MSIFGGGYSVHDRAAKLLGWSVDDARSVSLPSLRELVRPHDKGLTDEITELMRQGKHLYADQNLDGASADDKVWVEAEQDNRGGVALTLVDVATRRRVAQQHGEHVVHTSLDRLKNFPEQFVERLQQGYPVRFRMFQQAFESMLGGKSGGTSGLEGHVSMKSASAGWAKKMSGLKDTLTLDEVAKEFGLPTMEDIDELNTDYVYESGHHAYQYTLKEGQTEAEAEKAREKAESEAQTEIFRKWHNGVTQAVGSLFGEHGLELIPKTRDRYAFEYKLRPVRSWEDAADKIRETINGVGMFHFNNLREFLESGPYTARAAVLSHLHWIKKWPEVYGAHSARSVFDRAWR